jgi:peptidoglycan/xylan/chitin deacetylase (PgdA/CDA1 family)
MNDLAEQTSKRPTPSTAASGKAATDGVGILMYHRVWPRIEGAPAPTWNVTPQRLREQLAGLLALGFRPISLRGLVRSLAEGEPFPRNAFVVTFDDGYVNFFSEARAVLSELSVPATVFVPTAFLGSDEPFPFDDWLAVGKPGVPVESWKPMSVDQCRELAGDPLIDVGSHTHSHVDFRDRPDDFREDLRTSLDILRRECGQERPPLAFPFGLGCRQLGEAARECGVSCAVTIERRMVLPGTDRFDLGRFEVRQWHSPEAIARTLRDHGTVRERIRWAVRRRYEQWTARLRQRNVLVRPAAR